MSRLALVLAVAAGLGLPSAGSGQEAARRAPSAAEAREAFERLKGLVGEWEGRSVEPATGRLIDADARFVYRLTGAGTSLVELAYAGTAEEMLSVFFLDGERLMLQHYCSAGNQPRLELVGATPSELVFRFAGGWNVRADDDGHIHGARFVFTPDGTVESDWTWYAAGDEDHANRRVLRR